MTGARWTVTAGLGVALVAGAGRSAGLAQARFDPLQVPKSSKSCVVETRPLSFGTYDPISGGTVDGTGTVIVTCGNGKVSDSNPNNVRITISRGASNSYDRYMPLGDDHLRYNVYLDPSHTTVWGDGSGGTDYYVNKIQPNGKPVNIPAYGRIFGNQDIATGTYGDTLQVRIEF